MRLNGSNRRFGRTSSGSTGVGLGVFREENSRRLHGLALSPRLRGGFVEPPTGRLPGDQHLVGIIDVIEFDPRRRKDANSRTCDRSVADGRRSSIDCRPASGNDPAGRSPSARARRASAVRGTTAPWGCGRGRRSRRGRCARIATRCSTPYTFRTARRRRARRAARHPSRPATSRTPRRQGRRTRPSALGDHESIAQIGELEIESPGAAKIWAAIRGSPRPVDAQVEPICS